MPVALLVAGACLALVAIALAAAGGIDVDDAGAPLSAISDAGRLTSSRVLVCGVAAVGLAVIGVRGVLGASTVASARRLTHLGVALLVLSTWHGLWLTAGLTGVLTTGAAFGARRLATGDDRAPAAPID